MYATTLPGIGTWYESQEIEETFEVIAIDQENDCIDIQFFTGDLDELDVETWNLIHPTEIAEPEDYSGAYIMSKEDLVNYTEEVIHPERRSNPILEIESLIVDKRQ